MNDPSSQSDAPGPKGTESPSSGVAPEEKSLLTTVTPMLEDSVERVSCLRGYGDIVATIVACLGALSMGLTIGYSNPALQDRDLQHLLGGTERETWFASLVAIGAIFGGPSAGFLVAYLGRKLTLMLCTLPMGVGWFMITCGVNFAVLYIGRILCGLAMGMGALAAPLYIAEIASKARRGILGAGFQLSVSSGILVVYGIGIPLGWNWLAVVCMSVCTLNVVLLVFLPESPRWCAMQKRRIEGLQSLAWLADESTNIQEEYRDIEKNTGTQTKSSLSFNVFTKPAVYKPTLISFGMMFFQQMSGINIVIFYSSQIFATAGYADDPKLPTIIIGAVLVISAVISCVLMDRAGRRILLLVSSILMTISITTLGIQYYLTLVHGIGGLSWLSLTSVLIYVVFFSLGWGPIPWLIIPEVVPMKVRGLVSGLATCLAWILMFLITKEFERLRSVLKEYGAFWFFGGFCLASCAFVGLLVPETKGRTLEEIEEHFSGVRKTDKTTK